MTRPSPILLLFAAFSLACATSPAATPATSATSAPVATQAAPPPAVVVATPALNPVGTFDFTAIVPDGSEAPGSFTISGSPGAYTGTIERPGMGGSDLTSIVVDGQTLTIGANIPDGAVVLTLTFTGNDFTGKWSLGGSEGAIRGKRR